MYFILLYYLFVYKIVYVLYINNVALIAQLVE